MPYVFEDDYLTQLVPDKGNKYVFDENPTKTGYGEDIAKSIAYRGIPEGLAASTLGGYGLNVVRGVSDLTRWAAGKAYKAIEGEELPHYTDNPIPTSSDVLRGVANLTGNDLYEPKTTPGSYANTMSQFASGAGAVGLPIRASIAPAVLSETGGQLAKGTEYEVPARLAGAILGSRNLSSVSAPVKSAAEVREGASNLFKLAEREGGVVPSSSTNAFIDYANKSLPQTKAGKLVLGENSATQLVDRISQLKNKPLSLSEAHEIDSGLGQLTTKELLPTGKLSAEGQKIYDIQQQLRRTIDKLPDNGFKTLKEAKAEWAKSARMGDLERIIEKANSTDNPASSIRTAFSNLVKNKKQFSAYNKAEKSAIRQAAKTGAVTGALRIGGSRLLSAVVGTAGGAAGGGLPGALAGAVAGEFAAYPLRKLATASQMAKANNALGVVAGRGTPAANSPLANLGQSRIGLKPRVRVSAGGNP